MNTNEITVSLTEIRTQSPCIDGWRKVLAAKGPDIKAQFPLADIIETNDLDDALWTLRCRPEYSNLWRKYAVWCARQVEHLMTDERSKSALEVAWRYSEGSATDEELGAARDAAWDAAWGAAGAASSDAARAASSSAARAAAWDAQKQKLIEILNAGEWV